MRLFNILNAILQKCIQFSSEKFQDVSTEYSSSNLIYYQGWPAWNAQMSLFAIKLVGGVINTLRRAVMA